MKPKHVTSHACAQTTHVVATHDRDLHAVSLVTNIGKNVHGNNVHGKNVHGKMVHPKMKKRKKRPP